MANNRSYSLALPLDRGEAMPMSLNPLVPSRFASEAMIDVCFVDLMAHRLARQNRRTTNTALPLAADNHPTHTM